MPPFLSFKIITKKARESKLQMKEKHVAVNVKEQEDQKERLLLANGRDAISERSTMSGSLLSNSQKSSKLTVRERKNC